ncbi:hypothetical protein D9611_009820 [Ephemerocybe angulata]|uniref:Non-specific serine/threonine protein kinase n=1 Tax=Ephemerocybe angulata TaxID=980116 RepID=A0A8H5CDP8_9AGAR|nr:hypothetical protein D9611_009820 [Tulosesus angulatus]
MSSAATAMAAPAAHAQPSSSASPVIRTGTLAVRERTTFGGRTWRSRGVVLSASTLTIHQPSRHVLLPLGSITELERSDLTNHSLTVKCAGKTYHLSFDSDAELYDWRDDMYTRCPLGAQTTGPFNFQHTAHLGVDGAVGTFANRVRSAFRARIPIFRANGPREGGLTEPMVNDSSQRPPATQQRAESTTLPLYAELMGRSAAAAQGITPAAAAARTAAAGTTSYPGPSKSTRRRSNPLNGAIILNNNNNVNIEGVYLVKQAGMFIGWYWKERWLSLKGSSLTIHAGKSKASTPAKEIPLSTITSVEPDPKRSNCLFVATTQRETCLYILFPSDGDLYEWREAIYLRSGLSSDIGMPTDFMHPIHVSYDQDTGELKGFPDQWKVDPSLVQPLVAKISVQTGTNGRSSRRRSQPTPARGAHEALDLTSAIANATAAGIAKTAPNSPVAKSPATGSPTKSRTTTSSTLSLSPQASTRAPANGARGPPQQDLGFGAVAGSASTTGTSMLSQFSAGSSLDSQGTLVSLPGSLVKGQSLGKAPVLGVVQEISATTTK